MQEELASIIDQVFGEFIFTTTSAVQTKQQTECIPCADIANEDSDWYDVPVDDLAIDEEIQALEAALSAAPDNNELKEKLAVQYQAVQRSEEALALLFTVLQQDLNFGGSKKLFLDILAALPKGDSVASQYRRKLYSLLY